MTAEKFGDPTTYPFWEAARNHKLLIQRCSDCDQHQFYPRPLCVNCESDVVEWVEASGRATVYTQTTVRRKVLSELEPPYVVAIVELEEGPKMMTNIVEGQCPIGAPVQLTWREREDAPPLPVFRPVAE